jgi:hypothetical protein
MRKNHCHTRDRVLPDVAGTLRLPNNHTNLEGDFYVKFTF